MAIIKQYHKDTGITYVYESESYWDKEKKQPRSRRRLVGKLDPDTGEVIPTGRKKGCSTKEDGTQGTAHPEDAVHAAQLQQELCRLGNEILRLREQSGRLEEENRSLREILKKIGEMAGEA